MGLLLANTVLKTLGEGVVKTIDLVIPIPTTSEVSALSLAQKLQIPFCQAFVKNRYVGRTFIMPGQKERQKSVRRKLNAMKEEFKDKNVLTTVLFEAQLARRSSVWQGMHRRRRFFSPAVHPPFGKDYATFTVYGNVILLWLTS